MAHPVRVHRGGAVQQPDDGFAEFPFRPGRGKEPAGPALPSVPAAAPGGPAGAAEKDGSGGVFRHQSSGGCPFRDIGERNTDHFGIRGGYCRDPGHHVRPGLAADGPVPAGVSDDRPAERFYAPPGVRHPADLSGCPAGYDRGPLGRYHRRKHSRNLPPGTIRQRTL